MHAVAICLLSVLVAAGAHVLIAKDDVQNGLSVTLPADCVGKELCGIKPVDYPSEEIDRIARKLQSRKKRHHVDEELSTATLGNGCTASREIIQPFVAVYNQTAHLVIQSEFFKQTLPSVTCRQEGAGCLEGYTLAGLEPSCKTKFSTVALCVFDKKQQSMTNIHVTFPVDCVCSADRD